MLKDDEKPISKHRNHNWSQKVERKSERSVPKGNYIGALCMQCNINVTEKQNYFLFCAFFRRYDGKFGLEGVTNQETYTISEPGDNFVSFKLTEKTDENQKFSLNSVDSFNFLSYSTEKLVQSLQKIQS